MATCLDVFDQAMGLMDELDESGNTQTTDTTEYQNRTVFILNILQQECYPYSDTYEQPKTTGQRSVPNLLTSINDTIDMDDYICKAVLPYGLAAHLAIDDNPTLASFCQQRYEELLKKLKDTASLMLSSGSEDIYDVYATYDSKGNKLYGGLYTDFQFLGRW